MSLNALFAAPHLRAVPRGGPYGAASVGRAVKALRSAEKPFVRLGAIAAGEGRRRAGEGREVGTEPPPIGAAAAAFAGAPTPRTELRDGGAGGIRRGLRRLEGRCRRAGEEEGGKSGADLLGENGTGFVWGWGGKRGWAEGREGRETNLCLRPTSPPRHPRLGRASPPVGFDESPRWGAFFLPEQNNHGDKIIPRGSASFWQGPFSRL